MIAREQLRQEEATIRGRLKQCVAVKVLDKYGIQKTPRSDGEAKHNADCVALLLGPEPQPGESETGDAMTARSVFHYKVCVRSGEYSVLQVTAHCFLALESSNARRVLPKRDH